MVDGPDRTEPRDGALRELRAELASIDEMPLGDRVELFERANAVVAERLADLDEL